jgi:orotidine-5'-phosphate decarboxylase
MVAPKERLIIALDVQNGAVAKKLVGELKPFAGYFKIGKQLFTAEGPALVREIISGGSRVFLDLKFHDIPNTVAGAVASAGELCVSMLTVHAAGGSKMLCAAVEAAAASRAKPLVLAVTVLTSMSDSDLDEVGVSGGAMNQVLRLAALARNAGCQGVIASPQEARELRRELGEGFAIVTPGVRPASATGDDQARVATPGKAIAGGASHIVVGRPIIAAKDPAAAARSILDEIASAVPVSAQPALP